MFLFDAPLTPCAYKCFCWTQSHKNASAHASVSCPDLELLESKGHACACPIVFCNIQQRVHWSVQGEQEKEGRMFSMQRAALLSCSPDLCLDWPQGPRPLPFPPHTPYCPWPEGTPTSRRGCALTGRSASWRRL